MAAAAKQPPYSTIGGYRSGVWLIANDKGAAVVDRSHLPPEGSGFKYYWLGDTVDKARGRFLAGASALNVGLQLGHTIDLGPAFHGAPVTLPTGKTGILGSIENALSGGVFITGPTPTLTGEAGAAGAGEAAAAGAGGAGAASAAASAAKSLEAASAAGAILGFLGSLSNWTRLGEVILGAALLLLGLRAMTGGSGDPIELVRKLARA